MQLKSAQDELLELSLVREALESVLTPQLAGRLLYLALVEFGLEPPSTTDDLRRFVDDALANVLREHLDHERSGSLLSSVHEILKQRPRRASARSSAATMPPPGFAPEMETTQELPQLGPLLNVAVFAASPSLARRLATTFGGHRVACMTVTKLEDVPLVSETPNASVLILDASDLTHVSAEALMQTVESLPRRVLRVVWGADLPFGRRLHSVASTELEQVVQLRCDHGIEPLLDLIRARTLPVPSAVLRGPR